MATKSTWALFTVLCLAGKSEAAEQAVAVPSSANAKPEAVDVEPWRDAGPPSPPELLELVTPGSEWREENDRCVVKIDERTARRGRDDLKGTITYPDGRTKQLEGFVAGHRMILIAPYEFAPDGRLGSAIAPVGVVDGKVVIHVDWHKDHKDPNRKPVRLISPLKPPPRRPMPNDT